MLIYTHSNIAILLNTPSQMAGVTGAVFNSVRVSYWPLYTYLRFPTCSNDAPYLCGV